MKLSPSGIFSLLLLFVFMFTMAVSSQGAELPKEGELLTIKIIGFSIHPKRSGTASWDDTRGSWFNPIGRGFAQLFQTLFNTRRYLKGTYIKGGYEAFKKTRRDKDILDRKVEAPDPYVVIEYGKTKGCSKTVFATLDPTLNYVFPFFYKKKEPMKVRLYDYDFKDGAEVIGWLTFDKPQDLAIGEHWLTKFGRVLGLKYVVERQKNDDFCDNNLIYLQESFAEAEKKRKELAEKYPEKKPKKKRFNAPAYRMRVTPWEKNPVELDYRTMEFFYEENAIDYIPCCPHGGKYKKIGQRIRCSHQPTRSAEVILFEQKRAAQREGREKQK